MHFTLIVHQPDGLGELVTLLCHPDAPAQPALFVVEVLEHLDQVAVGPREEEVVCMLAGIHVPDLEACQKFDQMICVSFVLKVEQRCEFLVEVVKCGRWVKPLESKDRRFVFILRTTAPSVTQEQRSLGLEAK